MATEPTTRDEITVEVIYLLAVIVTPILLVLLVEIAAAWTFGLDSGAWSRVGDVMLGAAGMAGVSLAVSMNCDFRGNRRS